MQITEQL